MEKPKQKVGKLFLVFAGICIVALPLVVLVAMSFDPEEPETAVIVSQGNNFDENGEAIFINYDELAKDYIEGTSTERTLSEYYSRRKYPGSPPYIPHKVEEADLAPVECLTCHAKGGWTEVLKRHTPITPHPEVNTACASTSVRPQSLLPGAPPPIPHQLQNRGNCIACHVGPGTVAAIRVEHPSRGNCRQCHVPESNTALFERKAES